MNPDDIFQTLQKSFRVTLGATTAVIESIQDPYRREENLAKLRTNPAELADELAVKGEATEREARNFVDTLMSQPMGQSSSSAPRPTAPVGPTAPADIQADLKDLTEQIAGLRTELEQLRQQDG
jgi:polyhydroxyalkanoate synthesis regulator phasin